MFLSSWLSRFDYIANVTQLNGTMLKIKIELIAHRMLMVMWWQRTGWVEEKCLSKEPQDWLYTSWGLVLYVPGLVLFVPGLVLFVPGLVLSVPGLVLFVPGLVLFVPGLVLYFFRAGSAYQCRFSMSSILVLYVFSAVHSSVCAPRLYACMHTEMSIYLSSFLQSLSVFRAVCLSVFRDACPSTCLSSVRL